MSEPTPTAPKSLADEIRGYLKCSPYSFSYYDGFNEGISTAATLASKREAERDAEVARLKRENANLEETLGNALRALNNALASPQPVTPAAPNDSPAAEAKPKPKPKPKAFTLSMDAEAVETVRDAILLAIDVREVLADRLRRGKEKKRFDQMTDYLENLENILLNASIELRRPDGQTKPKA